MENLPNNLYHKIQQLSFEVREDLRKKGVVAPKKNKDGSVSVGRYRIVKNSNGYTVLNDYNEIVEQHLNLPQTAVLLANDLALGRFRDKNVVDNDRKYGYALFEEELHTRTRNRKTVALEYYDVALAKASEARSRKEYYKKDLLNKYEKLMRLV
jgi:hypothetical protein